MRKFIHTFKPNGDWKSAFGKRLQSLLAPVGCRTYWKQSGSGSKIIIKKIFPPCIISEEICHETFGLAEAPRVLTSALVGGGC
jgi:hypothetical protein